MERRSFMKASGMTISMSVMPAWMQLLNMDPFEMKNIRRNVGYFTEKGGTIGWLIHEKSIIIIDAQFPEQAGHLISEISKRGNAPIHYLINTHHHGDHTAGNIAFKGIAKTILAHENSKTNQINAAVKNGNESHQLYPNKTYSENWRKKCGGESIHMQYWGPAHTNGDSIIHFENANVVHCGDLMFNRRFPYIDKSAGAMIDNWISILNRMQLYFDNETIFIFGHAAEGYNVTGGKADLAAFADYLAALMEFVSNGFKSGKRKEHILAAKTIPGAPEWKGDGIERSLNAALEELGIE